MRLKFIRRSKIVFSLLTLLTFGISACLVVSCSTNDGNSPQNSRYHGKEFKQYYYFDEPEVGTILDEDGTVYGPNDMDGISLTNRDGLVYHPTHIAQLCINYFGGYISTKEEVYREIVLRHADWLVENQVITVKGFGVWYFHWPNRGFGADSPWISAMTQGQAISALLRANQLSEDPKYLKTAELALKSFDYHMEDGGVSYIDEDGFTWYEEVAVLPPAHVLNGFIFSLYGLYDYYRVTCDQHALNLFEEGVRTLQNKLFIYDTGEVSRYDLLLRGQLFRFVAPDRQPKSNHPIDKIVLAIDDSEITFDIGAPGDNDTSRVTGSFLWYGEDKNQMDWGPVYTLDGRTARDYLANVEAKYKHGAFRIKLPKEIPWAEESIQLRIQIHHKDVTTEDIYLEVYDGCKYQRIGKIAGKGTERWEIAEYSFPSAWLHFGGWLNSSYHDLVVKQLKGLYNITGEKFFLETGEKWAAQVK